MLVLMEELDSPTMEHFALCSLCLDFECSVGVGDILTIDDADIG